MRHDATPPASPARKRQRLLSSPNYDDMLGNISQEEIAVFDKINAVHSRSSSQIFVANEEGSDARPHSDENPFLAGPATDADAGSSASTGFQAASHSPSFKPASASFQSASKHPPQFGFTSATKIPLVAGDTGFSYERSPSPEAPPERDYSSWFSADAPAAAIEEPSFVAASAFTRTGAVPAFQTASSVAAVPDIPVIGFQKASNKGVLMPSKAALEKAKQRLSDIWQDDTADSEQGADLSSNAAAPPSAIPETPVRPALREIPQSVNSAASTTPSSSRPPSMKAPLANRPKPFKSPLLASGAVKKSYANSPLNPQNPHASTFSKASSQLSTHPQATPQRPVASTSSYQTPQVRRPQSRHTPSAFKTPFKQGMGPGQAGRLELERKEREEKAKQAAAAMLSATPQNKGKAPEGAVAQRGQMPTHTSASRSQKLSSTKPGKKPLSESGLEPQSFTASELVEMGVTNLAELEEITPATAIDYFFYGPPGPSGEPVELGPPEALDALLKKGCTLATKPWVDNHWCLILWKLAAMVALDPEDETRPKDSHKRWCWEEVINQLLYRYGRELNSPSRPALRLITTRDAPSTSPMVLAVTKITFSERGVDDEGILLEPHPELEVTDGWYRLRAQVDEPMARAVRRGLIRVGRKIAMAGARLSSESKDPQEVLEAYNSTCLILSGNSSHLAPWHAKLGFQPSGGPYICTLGSLTPDGGLACVLDLVVERAYPVAYIEFIEQEDGTTRREGPRTAADEARENDKWQRKRDNEAAKLHAVFEKKVHRYLGYAERCEQKAAAKGFQPNPDESPPDSIDGIYDQLEEPADANEALANISVIEAGWLAKYIRDSIEKESERARDDMEKELAETCPPRNVRSFRVIVGRDARTNRKPANRNAQITVWDVMNLALYEGRPEGTIEVGHRFLITNLMPSAQSAWMGNEPDAEIYLSTRRDTRWTRLKALT
ncbi:hypothetical protein EV714DRAFT_241592 [Schizophyllum commune]